jgi:hypothetical protein
MFEHTNLVTCPAAGVHLLASACHPAAALQWLFHAAVLLLRPLLLLPVLLLSLPWQVPLLP